MSILEALAGRQSTVLATTHYSEIKAFAMASEAYQNACMEFSVKTLSPTYKLIMGVPGVSNAFEISKKLGLSDDIIDQARKHMSEETVKFEQLIGEAERQREIAQRKEQQAENFRRSAQSIKDKSDIELKKAQEKRQKIIDSANEKALAILKEARDEAERVITELKKAKNAKQEDINAARKALGDKIDNTAGSLRKKPVKKSGTRPEAIRTGDTVRLINHGVKATVLKEPKDGQVYVQAGAVKLNVDIGEVEPTQPVKSPGRVGGLKRGKRAGQHGDRSAGDDAGRSRDGDRSVSGPGVSGRAERSDVDSRQRHWRAASGTTRLSAQPCARGKIPRRRIRRRRRRCDRRYHQIGSRIWILRARAWRGKNAGMTDRQDQTTKL